MAALIKTYYYPPRISAISVPPKFHGWLSPSQLASAELELDHDRAHPHAGDNTTQPAHWQTGM